MIVGVFRCVTAVSAVPGSRLGNSSPYPLSYCAFPRFLTARSSTRTVTSATRLRSFKNDTGTSGPEGLSQNLEVAVPWEQRPVNELQNLKTAWLYSWGILDSSDYTKRLILLFAFFFAVVGAPISYQTFDPQEQLPEFLLSSTVGGLLVVSAAVIRIYLGWSYVSDRLLSATVDYEETGWYDGQTFVKPPEVLTRDRLLGTFEVRPVLEKLRGTLVGSGTLLLLCSVLLVGFIRTGTDGDGVYGRGAARVPRQVLSDGVTYGARVKSLSELAVDDKLAEEEAAAQKGIPGYCGDRYLRAFAGGQYCAKFER